MTAELFKRIAEKAIERGLVAPSKMIQGATVELWVQQIGTQVFVTRGAIPPQVNPAEVGKALEAAYRALGQVLDEAKREERDAAKKSGQG